MSIFPDVVPFSFLRIKKEHPGWGAAVARPRVAERLSLPEEKLPSISTIERYWAQSKGRLYRGHHKRHPPRKRAKGPKPTEPHERWQADFKEKVKVAGIGQVDVLNIRDDASPAKIGSFVYASNEWEDPQTQKALRQAFTHRGLPACALHADRCDRLQTDKEKRLVSTGDDPFPSCFTLWPTGLGIAHNSPVPPRTIAVPKASIEPGIVG